MYILIFSLIILTLTQNNITLTQINTNITIIRGIFMKILKYLYNIRLILYGILSKIL
jgi:hypothetical protein